MNKIIELFGSSVDNPHHDWKKIVANQICPFLKKRCYKVRKSFPDISIGTCSILYGRDPRPIIICPSRLLETGKIFIDCIHLLTLHEPGNEFHVVSEISIPGGHVDFFLVSVRDGKVIDFVGIELQTLDTTGTVWPERQRLVRQLGISNTDAADQPLKSFGMNWKMTAKTILVQMHHKVKTFEHINKKIVLIIQDSLLDYMKSQFQFKHLSNPAKVGDAMHLHSYKAQKIKGGDFTIALDSRLSTDIEGIARCLGLQAEARVEMEDIIHKLQKRISSRTLFNPLVLNQSS